jgi:hypothetical protein
VRGGVLGFSGVVDGLGRSIILLVDILLDALLGVGGFLAVLTGAAHNKLILLYAPSIIIF